MSSEAHPEFDELENIEELDEAQDAIEEIGETSAEAVPESENSPAATSSGRFSFLQSLSIYDAMLIASALSVSLAILLMALELTSFGSLFFQWRTTEAQVGPLTLP